MTLSAFIYIEHSECPAWRACLITVRSGLIFNCLKQLRSIAAMETGDRVIQDCFLLGRDGLVNVLSGLDNPGEEKPQKCDDWDSFQSGERELEQDSVYLRN